MQKIGKEKKGITLIALVVTIIVLLILAGIAVSMLTGDNGLLNKAAESRIKTDKASILEQIKLAVMGSLGTDRKINYDKLKEELEDKDISVEKNGENYIIIKGDIIQIINKSGEDIAIEESSKSSGAGSIKLSKNDLSIKNLKIYGNSVQDGTPTSDNPIEIESIGDYDEETGKYKVPIKISGKNLFHYNNRKTYQDLTFLCKNSEGSLNGSNTSNMGNNYESNKKIILKKDTNYTLSYHYISGSVISAPYSFWLGFYSQENSWVRNSSSYIIGIDPNNYRTRLCQSIRVNEDTNVSFHYVGWGEFDNLLFGIQLEKGSKATEYEPYIEPVTKKIYLNEPLRKIEDYADYIDLKNNKIVRNVEVIDNTGTLPLEQSLRGLDKPIEESIDLPTIQKNAGTSIIEIGTEVTPSNMEVMYYTKK